MVRTYNFLAPSLHNNTLLDVSFNEPSINIAGVSSPGDPVVRRFPVKYGDHKPLTGVKRMVDVDDNRIVVADDTFQVSTIQLSPADAEEPDHPTILFQETVKARSKDIWAGLVPVENGTVSALKSGHLTFHPFASESPSSSRSVPSPLACLASTPLAPTQFALGGKEVDVSIYDVERTFASSSDTDMSDAKRKKNALLPGQIWQAKNMPNNYLKLRPPVYHLALSWLDSPDALVSGTKMGTIRRFDTRQRKPVDDWKVSREGGIASLTTGLEHEVFFADRSNYLGALDLRTGKVLYSYSSLTATPHHMLPIPRFDPSSSLPSATRRIGFASISSDASIRIHSATTPPSGAEKGNWGPEGKKGDIVGMVGGVGIGEAVWRGYGERKIVVKVNDGEEGEEGESEDEEEVWEGMDVYEDEGEGSDVVSDEESESESEEEAPKKKKRSKA
ncbi:hypothetical protein L202_01419 [Cryptococcus amylolentus CBS 6039]|uniref:Ribosome biogenesis protein NSA1 n=1 Tax=Cryptococcus amylolentus CBS 6039 TaxID=1295533 RepID=A0A1E3I3N9_9TREE|nr:hypothetical protein L202_01419 [Cryptococcus amylolentus CBS 6039]ODN83244.1 hypothetical protein L202_01419 [Cryptococcus amylolentus CBS 6039]